MDSHRKELSDRLVFLKEMAGGYRAIVAGLRKTEDYSSLGNYFYDNCWQFLNCVKDLRAAEYRSIARRADKLYDEMQHVLVAPMLNYCAIQAAKEGRHFA